MVIAVFIRQLSLGGAEKQSLLLTRELQKLHPAFLVVWTREIIAPEYREFIERHGLRVVFLEGTAVQKFFNMWRFFLHEKVTHVFNFLLINNLVGGLAARLAGVSHIYGGIRNCEIVPSKLRWQRMLHNYVSHKTIFNNHAGAVNLFKKGFRSQKIEVIHNGIDLNGEPPVKEPGEVPVVFTAARFLPQKDYLTALKALSQLAAKGKRFTYIMAGYGKQEGEIRQWVRELDLEDFVEVKIAPPDLPALFNRADIYLSTSQKEGLSNSIMEALAAGLPVVATNVGDNKYLVKDGANGMLAEVGDVHKLVRSLERLMDEEMLRREMGRTGYRHLEQKFSSTHFLNQYLELLNHGK